MKTTVLHDPFGADLPQTIAMCDSTLHELIREAEMECTRFNSFTYAQGPGAKRPTRDWSRLAPHVQIPRGTHRFYIYWRLFKATIKAGDSSRRISSQVPMAKGRLIYRRETLMAKAQPWEHDELWSTEVALARIRRRAQALSVIRSNLLLLSGGEPEEAPS